LPLFRFDTCKKTKLKNLVIPPPPLQGGGREKKLKKKVERGKKREMGSKRVK
jgi:hypothetical protein